MFRRGGRGGFFLGGGGGCLVREGVWRREGFGGGVWRECSKREEEGCLEKRGLWKKDICGGGGVSVWRTGGADAGGECL